MSRTIVNFPVLGEGVVEGTLSRWLVAPGEVVRRYQPLVEVETDKVSAELPSPAAGVVAEILVPAGAAVSPGTPICVVVSAVDAAEGAVPQPPAQAAGTPSAEAAPPAGPISPADIRRLVAARGDGSSDRPRAPAPPPRGPAGMRRRIAERLSRSWREAPHAWMLVECDVTGLVALRDGVKEDFRGREGCDLTYLPFFVKAVVAGLRAEPVLNAVWREDAAVPSEAIELGIAVALQDGLVVPVFRQAETLSLAGLAIGLQALIGRARSGRLLTEDLDGGTFTINNIGAFGSVASMPIINPPQAGIVTMESIVARPVVVGEGIAIRQRVNLCLSFDHRVADGAAAGRFLQGVRAVMEGYRPGVPIY